MIGLVAHQEDTLLAKQTPQPLLLGPPTFVGPLENPKVCKIIFQLRPYLCVHLPAHDSSLTPPLPFTWRGETSKKLLALCSRSHCGIVTESGRK